MKSHVYSTNGTKESEKTVGFKDNCVSIGSTDSHNPEQDICHWQPMCYETPLEFNISLREIFPISGSPRVMKEYDESVLMQISQEFGNL